MAFIGGGVDRVVGTSGEVAGFDPLRDRLDFGDISVHGMILGKLVDGSAVIVNPWQQDSYQRITDLNGDPVRWDQLAIENFAPVGNEHLRADAGGVISWELGVGPRSDAIAADAEGRIDFTEPGAAVSETVYIRSHEYGVQEVVSNFDPENDKISFIYLGTRERVSAVDTDQGLLISVEPSGQSVLIEGVQSTQLRADNVEFHFDQVREDNLEAVLGFDQNDVALVDRTVLLTPAAPTGASTDGFQVELGNPVYSIGAQLASAEPADHSGHGDQDHSGGHHHDHGYAAGTFHLQASGTLYWGGMSGTLTITNMSDRAIENWSVSFETPHRDFQSWAGDAVVEALEGGGNRVTLTPAAWNSTIGAGQSIAVSFNAESVGLDNSGELSSALFFLAGQGLVEEGPDQDTTPPFEPPSPEDAFVDDGDENAGSGDGAAETNTPVVPSETTLSPTPQGDRFSDLNIIQPKEKKTGQYRFIGTAQPDALISTAQKDIMTGRGGADLFAFIRTGGPIDVVTDFNRLDEDKIGIDAETFPGIDTIDLAIANNKTEYQQLKQSDANIIYQAYIGKLVYNENGSRKGLGSDDAAIAKFKGNPLINSDDIVLIKASSTPSSPQDDPGSNPPTEPADSSLVEEPEPGEGSAEVIADPGKRVVAYFEEWGIYQRDFLVSDINVGELTHVNYSFFDVKANGDVQLFDSWAATDKRFSVSDQVTRTFSAAEWKELSSNQRNVYSQGGEFKANTNGDGSVTVTGVPMDWNTPVDYVGNLRQFDLLKQLNPEINLGLALGGWTLSDEFSLAVDSAADREAFTSSIVDTLQRFDFFNTVDFDWEYPGGGGETGNAVSPEDGVNFALTLELLRTKLDALETSTGEEYEISVATAGGYDKLANLNLTGIDPYVDFYNVMTYDFHGGWESVTGHQAAMVNDPGGYDVVTAIQQFQDNGIDLSKVVLGAPAYTRAWGNVDAGGTLGLGNPGDSRQAPGSFEAGNYDQKDLITGVADGSFTLVWDDDSKAAFVYNANTRVWSSIETAATIAGKAAYVDALGLGGMMFWALSNDSNGDQSLISAASDLLMGGATPDEVMARSLQFDYVLGGDGQFGLDDFTLLA